MNCDMQFADSDRHIGPTYSIDNCCLACKAMCKYIMYTMLAIIVIMSSFVNDKINRARIATCSLRTATDRHTDRQTGIFNKNSTIHTCCLARCNVNI